MFIPRDYTRSQQSDFLLNVAPHLSATTEAVPQYAGDEIVGWKIQPKYS